MKNLSIHYSKTEKSIFIDTKKNTYRIDKWLRVWRWEPANGDSSNEVVISDIFGRTKREDKMWDYIAKHHKHTKLKDLPVNIKKFLAFPF